MLTEKVISPSELTITFIHCSNPKCEECTHAQRTMAWLDEIISTGEQEKVPPLTVVLDSETEKLLVYDGNVRLAHALQKNYNLRVLIISNQAELNSFLETRNPSWFGIGGFQQLIEYMRVYAAYPEACATMPPELKEKLNRKYQEWQQARELAVFGPDDD